MPYLSVSVAGANILGHVGAAGISKPVDCDVDAIAFLERNGAGGDALAEELVHDGRAGLDLLALGVFERFTP